MADVENGGGNSTAAALATTSGNRRSSLGGESTGNASHMSEAEQSVKRKQIKEIMLDTSLSQTEKNKLIHGLMDGRKSRRSSLDSNLSRSAESTSASASSSLHQQQQQHPYNNYAASVQRAVDHNEFENDDMMGGEAGQGGARRVGGGRVGAGVSAPSDIYGYSAHDNRSVASSISPRWDEEEDDRRNAENIPAGQYRQLHGRSFSLPDWNEESRATVAANFGSLLLQGDPEHLAADPQQVNRLVEKSRPPCSHYERNCTIIAPCCGLAFGCRICHDDCPVLPPPVHMRQHRQQLLSQEVVKQAASHHHQGGAFERRRSMPSENEPWDDDEENHHLIDRFAIREVICRKCFTRQSSKTNICKNCGIQFGVYHCQICNLWMSDSESPYHCNECGFCRVGGRQNFRHCRECGMCIDANLFENHNCKAGKYNSNCPVCQQDLFSSRQASHEMRCGHAIHWHCFKELTSFDTRCPVCKKTAESPEQMASTWSALAMAIALQPVPPELARCVNIICNDCEERDYERRWHFLGVRCMHCLSFNTTVEQILLQGQEAAQYLDQQEAERGHETGGVPPTILAMALRNRGNYDDNDDVDDDDGDAMMDDAME